ncbi:MAG TPA: PLP-dependent aminotransferase family protein [Terrimesophilobacter sp.]|nr:PLP-dependent aminotransferase family protein [Terrimesophilobacter sp.]
MASVSARALAALLADWRAASAGPAYTVLADRIRLLILDGRIAYGTRMPAERELAAQLGMSRTTITAAYAELRDGGYLDSQRGSGSSARIPQSSTIPAETAIAGYLDFTKATSPASSGLAAAAVLAAEDYPAYLGGSGFDLVGLPVLRTALAARFTSRGLPTEPEQLMVTVGAQHAIALLARTFLGRGSNAIVESPSYPHAFEALRLTGARLATVNVTTDDGWDVAALDEEFRRSHPAFAYLMPDFHNPTGRTMDAELRERVVALAEAAGCALVADETTAELDIDGPAPGAERPLPIAAFGPAVTVGSLAKTVWGGLRIGWIRAERDTIQRLVRARPAGDLGTPILDQLVAAHILADFDAVLAQRRDQLRAGRDHLVATLRERFPEWRVPDVAGGLAVWAGLGAPVSSQLALAARARGLLIAAGPRFGVDGAFERFLRIPFSYSAEETDRAVDALAAAWASLGQGAVPESTYLAEVV